MLPEKNEEGATVGFANLTNGGNRLKAVGKNNLLNIYSNNSCITCTLCEGAVI